MDIYFQDIEHHIIRHIRFAQSRLLVAVAWFTNEKIGQEIIKKKAIDVEIIVDDNPKNRNCKNLFNLQAQKIDICFVKDLTKKYYLMHNKFCVIDSKIVISGSYNWTLNANSNDENISIFYDQHTAALYSQEFRRIKSITFPNNNVSITYEEVNEITALMYPKLLQLLKENINNLNEGLLLHWTDTKIKNKIRSIDEKINTALHDRSGRLVLYYGLITKYGFGYENIASEEEKVKARDDFKKRGLEDVEYHIHRAFQFLKIRTINELLDNYKVLLKKESDAPLNVQKILKVWNFIIRVVLICKSTSYRKVP